jgi:spermidine synthase
MSSLATRSAVSSSSSGSAIEDQRSKASFRFVEAVFPGVDISVELKEIMTSSESPFQKVQAIRTAFGKMLVTDGKTQSTQMDEYVYHESLVHPSLIKNAMDHKKGGKGDAGAKSVFIGGGGELATAREVLRHKSVERLVMVDLDEHVLNVCKQYLPEWGGEKVVKDPRLELIIGDAYTYLTQECKETFDVIIMDISDPIEAGPGIMLYTQEFYTFVKSLLNPHGVFVTQAGIADGVAQPEGVEPGSDDDFSSFAAIFNTLGTVFDCVIPYSVNIPSFGCDWGFVMAFDTTTCNHGMAIEEHVNANAAQLDDMVEQCIVADATTTNNNDDSTTFGTEHANDNDKNATKLKKGGDLLRYYDGLSHRRMFSLPKPLRENMKKDRRIMTKENPVFMY